MVRTILVALGALALAGCWGSDERLLGPGDWASVALDGDYRVETIDGDESVDKVAISTGPDRLVRIAPAGGGQGRETLTIGLAAIPGGTGRYFVAVDRGERGTEEGDLYVIARIAGNALEFYFPECEGTPDMAGMVRESDLAGEACGFQTKEALFAAALQAERYLSEKHIVTISPFTRFERIEPDDGVVID